ncbi:hypothetical protein ABW20_dc0106591 [Dactylellina cionopaga]|nr:hypothetical protein ABW20_dc0106591 [Dactylellina cionopaga]
MHELTLFAHVPTSRIGHAERALTTVTGMSGVPVLEHHLIYKPKRSRQSIGSSVGGNGSTGPANQAAVGDFYYLKLVTEIPQSSGSQDGNETAENGEELAGLKGGRDSDVMEIDPPPPTASDAASTSIDGNQAEIFRRSKETSTQLYDVQQQKWILRFSDLPEVNGKRPVTSRMIHHAAVQDGDALSFVDSLGYV